MKFEGQQVCVLGLAKSGLAAAELLRREGARVRAVDSRAAADIANLAPLLAGGRVEFVQQSEATLDGIDLLVTSPGVPLANALIQAAFLAKIPVIGELELAAQFLRGPVIAISGSNGKTTTTALTGHILSAAGISAQVGGNIGRPVTDLIDSSSDAAWNVLEVSSFQLETVSTFHARIATVLNVTPNHLDRHGDFATYAAAKGKLFQNQTEQDYAVLNAGNATSAAYAQLSPAAKLYFNGADAYVAKSEIILRGERLMDAAQAPLPGRHNQENIMAAALLTSLAGASHEQIAQAVTTFQGVPHRLEFVRSVRGVRYFNDSKATSVDATLKALEALEGPLWVILGGVDKGGSYLPLGPQLHAKAKACLLIGAATPVIAAEFQNHSELSVKLLECENLENAVALASREAVTGDTVLLAPACASYDQFTSYEQRGERFKMLVREL